MRTAMYIGVLALVLSALFILSSRGNHTTIDTGEGQCKRSANEMSIFFAGDSIIVKPWSTVDDPAFQALVNQIQHTDVAITNLETVIHSFKGFAQADSGGTYMSSPPEIASELAWAGFDMVAHANNHTFDFGSAGVLETLENVAKAGLVLAGSGKDLQDARAPAYFKSSKGTVALVATTSTYLPYGRASISRPDLPGRPGLNPLNVSWSRTLSFKGPFAITIPWPARINSEDLDENLKAVREAKKHADLVVFSIHAHERNGQWLQALAHQVIDAGADVFFAHGPHEVLGIEIYHCKPILYGLGDFVYEQEQIQRLPPEYYEEQGLKGNANWEELQALRDQQRKSDSSARHSTHESLGAILKIGNTGVSEIRLLPLDLGFNQAIPNRGRPRLAEPLLGSKIIADLTERSKSYGTTVQYLNSENIGVVTVH